MRELILTLQYIHFLCSFGLQISNRKIGGLCKRRNNAFKNTILDVLDECVI